MMTDGWLEKLTKDPRGENYVINKFKEEVDLKRECENLERINSELTVALHEANRSLDLYKQLYKGRDERFKKSFIGRLLLRIGGF